MLRIAQVCSPVRIESGEFQATLNALASKGWLGAALEAGKRFSELAGAPDVSFRGSTVSPDADVFFRSDGIFFLVGYDILKRPPGDSDTYYRISGLTRQLRVSLRDLGLTAGVISTTEGDADLLPRLENFRKDIEEAIRESIDGRKARHLKFEWAPIGASNRLEILKEKLTEEGGAPRFTVPSINDQEINGADILADSQARILLRELREATFARETDILSRRGRKEEEARQVLQTLRDVGLVTVEYLLQCRKNSTSLTRLTSKEQLKQEAVAILQCAACSRTYENELLTEGYIVSDLGRKLISGSYWMTVWVTKRLMEAGIQIDSILWNLEESGEEVDILVSFLGRLWILELKDREFGPGDAHPFRYRRVRYGADKAIIVTTAKVSDEAKRIFRELDAPRRGSTRLDDPNLPLCIEGLTAVAKDLRTAIDQASFDSAIQALEIPSFMIGFDMSTVVKFRAKEK